MNKPHVYVGIDLGQRMQYFVRHDGGSPARGGPGQLVFTQEPSRRPKSVI